MIERYTPEAPKPTAIASRAAHGAAGGTDFECWRRERERYEAVEERRRLWEVWQERNEAANRHVRAARRRGQGKAVPR